MESDSPDFIRDKWNLKDSPNASHPLRNSKWRPTLQDMKDAERFLGVASENFKKIMGEIQFQDQNNYDGMLKLKRDVIDLVSGKDKNYGLASELIVNYILKNNKILTTKDDLKPEMWIYQDGIYMPNGRTFIKEVMRDILEERYNQFLYGLVIGKIEPDTYITPEKLFSNNYVYEIPVQNGILNILTKELSEFNPDKIFFNKLPVFFDPEAQCPKIEQFIKDILSHAEDIQLIEEMLGCFLIKENIFEKAFMFVGDGRNGKTKLIELFKRFLGHENCYSLPLSALRSDNPDVHQLFGKMLNLAGDISNTDLKETGLFKELTGRGTITAKRKFLNAISFSNFAKFVFGCNDLPMVYDTSKGFWERWELLEFPFTFVSQEEYDLAKDKTRLKIKDEFILDRITDQEELNGMLNLALAGLSRLMVQKKFSSTKGSDETKNIWIRRSNSFVAFCFDNLEEDYEGVITKKELRKRYAMYCKQHKIKSRSDMVIKMVLQENFGVTDGKVKVASFPEEWDHSWIGVKWKV